MSQMVNLHSEDPSEFVLVPVASEQDETEDQKGFISPNIEEVPWSSTVSEHDPEAVHIKAEEDKLRFSFTAEIVKMEEDEEKPQSLILQIKPEENGKEESQTSISAEQMISETVGETNERREPACISDPYNNLQPNTDEDYPESSEIDLESSRFVTKKRTRRLKVDVLTMLQDISAENSDGGQIEEFEDDEVSDPTFSPDSSSSSSDYDEPEKRPRLQAAGESRLANNPVSSEPSVDGPAVTASLDSCHSETAKDGTVWTPVEPKATGGRFQSQNIHTEKEGLTPYSCHNIRDPLTAFVCLVDRVMLQDICDCTIAEAHRCGEKKWELSIAELRAFIALLLARGVHNRRDTGVEGLWSKEWGVPFFTSTMSRNRFRDIMRFLRFDQKHTRCTRLSNDKFALVRNVWDRLIQNSLASFKPGAEITIYEQLFPTKSRCPFTQFMPKKTFKFGIKFWLAVDVDTKYIFNGYPYLGKDPSHPTTQRLGEDVVLTLMEPVLGEGRNVTTDGIFTSLHLAHTLLEKNTSLLGIITKNKISLPLSVHQKAHIYDTKVMLSERATLTIYQRKERKSVCILSTMHKSVEITEGPKKKPSTVQYYNRTRKAVDILDKTLQQFSSRAATRRWPVAVFYNILDIAALNAWVLYRSCVDSKITRRAFILELCQELRVEHVLCSSIPISSSLPTVLITGKRRSCTIRRKCAKNKTSKTCVKCLQPVCGQCTVRAYSVCMNCE
uniref:PiggyBac transposable element-derived protein domain-containing protein n=1 Tax=Nothobranchius furzeri TaxID=105023 RepID=A0A1A8U1F2_NOTFU